jgi:ABC-type Fe3+-hydroxamate transport system substrate-binding protein
MRPALLLALSLLAACGEFPTAGAPTGSADYPRLLPYSVALEGVPQSADEAGALFDAEAEAEEALQAQAAALQSRADTIREAQP